MIEGRDVDLCVATCGDADDPAVLLIAGAAGSMDWWDDEFCRRLAAGGRLVITYDHRDTGRSTAYPVGEPPYTRQDLADDALVVLDALEIRAAHLVGFGLGGDLAQRIAVGQPGRVLSLTLIATGPDDADSGEPGGGTDWGDRRAAVDRMVRDTVARGGLFTADEQQLRRLAERIFDRTADLASGRANHRLMGLGPPVRDRRPAIAVPTLVMHGTADPVLGREHAETLTREIPGARLVLLEGVGHEFPPPAVWPQVVAEILRPLTPSSTEYTG